MKEKAKERINALVQKYERLKSEGRIKSYNEEMTKKDFILPLFEALGWDVYNTHADEVSAEEKVSKGRVDYGFRIEGIPKLFLEAKALKFDLDDFKHAEQAINYAWHKGVVWAILTDFETVRVFNAEVKTANPAQSQFFALHANQFLDRFEQLWLLSRESLVSGAINIEAEKWGKKLKKIPVDKQLLADFTSFRELLSKSVLKNNPQKRLTEEDIDESVQRLLDRLIFIRTTEDKEIEPPHLMPLLREDTNKRIVKKLNTLFRYYDDTYNSKLFQPHLCEDLEIDDHVLEHIIQGLYRSKEWSIHYNFALLDADILGSIYEQYLGHILKKTEKRAKLTEGKTHRKEQGIYYTPTYIVDYIVKNTIGELAKDKKFDIDKIKILDPACGSGSFLIKAFDFLNQYHSKKGTGEQTKIDTSGAAATFTKKLEILKNNIYGVDLDPKAVEIAQLNLLLKAAEKKHRLPTLQENIKCGNSLIDDTNIAGQRAFKWEEEFSNIMKNGGFDVVIGNPPWGAKISEPEKKFYLNNYKSIQREIETHLLFIELSIRLTRYGGHVGLIVPNTWMYLFSTESIREQILKNCEIISIVELTKYIFADAPDLVPVIIILKKIQSTNITGSNIIKTKSFSDKIKIIPEQFARLDYEQVKQKDILTSQSMIFNVNLTSENKKLLDKIRKDSVELGKLATVSYGIKTGNNEKFVKNSQIKENFKKCLKSKEVSRYGICWNNLWLDYGPDLAGYTKNILTVPKIIVQYIRKLSLKRRLICGFDGKGEYYPLNNYSYITGEEKILLLILGILNSKLMNFYFANTFIDYNIKPTYLSKLPMKIQGENELVKKLSVYVSKILADSNKIIQLKDKQTEEKRKTEEEKIKLDTEIDEIVYKLYGLTETEKKIVEDSLKSD